MSKKKSFKILNLIIALTLIISSIPFAGTSYAVVNGMSVTATSDADVLINELLSDEVKAALGNNAALIQNKTLINPGNSAATFVTGTAISAGGEPILDFDKGIVLSTGDVNFLNSGTNTVTNKTKSYGKPGDSDLNNQISGVTKDATALEFDLFCPADKDGILFEYVLSSEEYNEYINYPDAFGIFVTSEGKTTNIATIPDSNNPDVSTQEKISIGTINHTKNVEFYRNNTSSENPKINLPCLNLPSEMDGFTKTMVAYGKLTPNAYNHIKLVIADAKDDQLDSNVFIKAKSMRFSKPQYGELSLSDFTDTTVKIERTNGTDGAVKADVVFCDAQGQVISKETVPLDNGSALETVNVPVGAEIVKLENPKFGAVLGDTVLLTKTVAPPKVSGVVYDSQTKLPAAGATVSITDLEGKPVNKIENGVVVGNYTSVKTDANGAYSFEGLVPNIYHISAELNPYATTNDVLNVSKDNVTFDIYLSKLKLELIADPLTIVGDGVSTSKLKTVVMDENGLPIPNVNVELSADLGSFIGSNTGKTDAEGRFSTIFQSSKITGVQTVTVPIKAKVTLENGMVAYKTIQMTFEPASINGTLKDKDGNPVSGALVKVSKDFNKDGITDFYAEAFTDANGKYKIAVPEGNTSYNLEISQKIIVGQKEETLTYKQTAEIKEPVTGKGGEDFLSNNTFSGIIKSSADGKNTINIVNDATKFSIQDPQKFLPNASVDADGRFSIEGLEKDKEYILDIVYTFPNGETIKMGELKAQVAEDGELRIGEALVDPYGTITDSATGAAIPGVQVQIFYADSPRNNDAKGGIYAANTSSNFGTIPGFAPADNANPQVSDAAGFYAWMVKPDTDYYIVATKPGYNTYVSPIISVYSSIVNHDFQMVKKADKDDAPAKNTTDNTVNNTPLVINNNGIATIGETKKAGDTISIKEGTATNGSAIINQDGKVTFIPDRNYVGSETITVVTKSSDGKVSEKSYVVVVNESKNIEDSKKTLTISSKADKTVYDSNEEIIITLTYKNKTEATAKDVLITTVLPKGVEIVDSHNGIISDGQIFWTISDIKPGEEGVITLIVKKKQNSDVSNAIEKLAFVSAIKQSSDSEYERTEITTIAVRVMPHNGSIDQIAYIIGRPSGAVESDEKVTRAEVAAMIIRANRLERFIEGELDFKDVSKDDWYAGYVEAAQKSGFMNGNGDSTFNPLGNMTRAEMITLLANFYGMNSVENSWEANSFSDISGHWAQNDINAAFRYNLISGYADGTFKPNQKITRAEAVNIINKILVRKDLDDVKPSFNDLTNKHWSFGKIEAAHRGYMLHIVNGKCEYILNK